MAQKVHKVRQQNNFPILQTPSIPEDAFYQNDLGRLHLSIPFKELALKIPSPPQSRSGRAVKLF